MSRHIPNTSFCECNKCLFQKQGAQSVLAGPPKPAPRENPKSARPVHEVIDGLRQQVQARDHALDLAKKCLAAALSMWHGGPHHEGAVSDCCDGWCKNYSEALAAIRKVRP